MLDSQRFWIDTTERKSLPRLFLSPPKTTKKDEYASTAQNQKVTLIISHNSYMSKSVVKVKPIFVQEDRLSITRFTSHQSQSLRSKLPRSIYWIQPVPRGKTHWNEELLSDWLLNGDTPQHKQLVEKFVASLQKAA